MDGCFANDLGHYIIRLNRGRRRYLAERLKEYDLTGPMHIILLGVRRHPGISQECLAELYYIDKASVARCARRLEELSYLRRETSSQDRRLYALTLTPEGEALARKVQCHSDAWSRQLSAGFTEEERVRALSLLSRMSENSDALF